MKKILFIMICFVLFFPFMASAHTTLESSTPSAGEVVTTELKEITLEFAGEIENKSTFTLKSNNDVVQVDSITVDGKTLTGQIPTPLKNGEYTITWNIAATDGHLLSGEIPFTVNIPNQEESEVQEDPAAETDDAQVNEEQSPQVDNDTDSNNEESNDNRSIISTVSIIVLVILLAVGIGILIRKKR
ncbi:hypothetical protein CHH83_16440 [Bacillus sp. 7586-K]|nr:hypothetical protein CHH83_16440 [Bacillus sp. 7586-K]